jgi:phosphatidylserine decarboxylase
MVWRSRCHHQHSPRTQPSSVSSLWRRLLPALAVVRKKTPTSSYPARQSSGTSSDAEDYSSSGSGSNSSSSSEDTFEHVINVKNCPICHRPRLNEKAEMDIITHVAVCASGDWAKIDKIVVGNFVTSSQAQRKWYTKVISKVSSGDYRLGAVRFSLSLYLNAPI